MVRTPFGIYETTRRVSQSEPVSHIMTSTDLIAFSLEEQVDDIKETMLRFKYRYFPVLDDEGRPVEQDRQAPCLGLHRKERNTCGPQ